MMKYILVGVEGKVSEVAGILGVLGAMRQQSPRGYQHLEVVPLPLGGNHGHGQTLIAKYSDAVQQYLNNPDNCVESSDIILKRLVCDYDNMEKHGRNEAVLRSSLASIDTIPVISKPKFEYFAARLFLDKEELDAMLEKGIHVNAALSLGIERYNNQQTHNFLKLKPYTKKEYPAKDWFGALFNLNPDFLKRSMAIDTDINSKYYTEIPKLIREIADNFEE